MRFSSPGEPDPAVSEVGQVADTGAHPGRVVDGHAGRAPGALVQVDHGHRQGAQSGPLAGRQRERGDDDRVRVAAGGQRGEELRPFGLVEDTEDQQLLVRLPQPAEDRVQDGAVEPAVQPAADQHRDPPEAAGGQPRSAARDREARARPRPPGPGPRWCRGHQVGAAQGARHGGHRDARALGHVGHGGDLPVAARWDPSRIASAGQLDRDQDNPFHGRSGLATPPVPSSVVTSACNPRRPSPATPGEAPAMSDQLLLAADRTLDADWWRQACVYQVYPRSFADSDGNGIGDIAGVTSRMGYLADLGVDAIWLSPFYPSALADGGYDVADYRDVAPELGTLADFDDHGRPRPTRPASRSSSTSCPTTPPTCTRGSSRRWPPSPARPSGPATSSATAPARTAPSRRRTGSRTSAGRRGPGCRTRRRRSGTATSSRPSSPT